MPRNSDFPNYKGISVSHADGIDPREANQRSFNKSSSKEQKVGGFQPIKGMVSPRKRREQTLLLLKTHLIKQQRLRVKIGVIAVFLTTTRKITEPNDPNATSG